MIRIVTIATLAGLASGMGSVDAQTPPANPSQARLEIRSVAVGGKALPLRLGEAVRLPAFPENVAFGYGAADKSNRVPTRLRYKLEGYDHQWHESWGQMFLAIRFLDEAGEQIARKTWNVSGESPGWNGELASATLNHRREIGSPGGLPLRAPTPPYMRVRVRRFLTVLADEAALFLCHDDRCPELGLSASTLRDKTTDGRVCLPSSALPEL